MKNRVVYSLGRQTHFENVGKKIPTEHRALIRRIAHAEKQKNWTKAIEDALKLVGYMEACEDWNRARQHAQQVLQFADKISDGHFKNQALYKYVWNLILKT